MVNLKESLLEEATLHDLKTQKPGFWWHLAMSLEQY